MKTINRHLLHQRIKQKGFTYAQLAKITKISRNTVRNILIGETTPSHYVSVSLTQALKLTKEDTLNIFFPNIEWR